MHKLLVVVALVLLANRQSSAQNSSAADRAGVESFNRAFDEATRRMDTRGTLALWEENGVSLLPSTRPIVGKAAITAFINGVMASLPNAHMESFVNRCYDITVSGSWASEWCVEHQIVLLPEGKRFDGWGKMSLVLHRAADGVWRLRQEMWNQAEPADSVMVR